MTATTNPATAATALHKAWEQFTKENKESHGKRISHLNKELLIGAALAIVGIAATIFLGYFVLGVALVAVGCVLGRNAWKERKAAQLKQAPLEDMGKFITTLQKQLNPNPA